MNLEQFSEKQGFKHTAQFSHKNFILKEQIDLIIVGPEKPLVEGLVDYLEKLGQFQKVKYL